MADNVPAWAQSSSPDIPSWAGSSAAPSGPSSVPTWAQTPGTQTGSQFWDKMMGSELPQQQPQALQRRQLSPAEAALSPWEKITHGIADPDHPNMWNVVYGLSGAYNQSVTNGLMMQPVRAAMEASGYGMDKVRQLYPNASPDQQKAILHNLYNQAVQGARTQAAQQTLDNPYPGHQVGNFAAGVLGSADPTWLLAPGAGTGKTALARIGTAAGKQAALASMSNSAAQAMDIMEGQKKDYDVRENLTQAAFGGAFGGAFHGVNEAAPVVSDYVANLFKTRGRDTTPSATPMGDTTPLTGSEMSMTPEDRQTLKTLIRSGSVDDIKNFINTKQGPKPTWAQVDSLVQARDAMPESYVGQQNFESAIDQTLSDHQHQLVSDHVAAQTKDWKNAPDIEVVRRPEDIQDPNIRQQVLAENPEGGALGVFGSDGKVRLFSDNIHSPELANSVLYHEALGHYGLQQQFGAGLDRTLQTLLDRNVGKFGNEVDNWQKANPGAYNGDRLRAAEEVLAERSQNGQLKPAWQDAVVAKLRQFGRRMGLNLAYSDNEIQHILAMAHDAVVNGKGRDVRANGFQGTKPAGSAPNSQWLNMSGEDPVHKFMFTGQHAANFDPEHPTAFTPSDGHVRNEISDHNSQFMEPAPETTNRLEDVLHHPELYENYPDLRDLPVTHTKMEGLDASYSDRGKGRIYLNTDAADKHTAVLHEVQHAIQQREGITAGDNMKMSDEEYNAQPVEKEAVATEARKDMTPEERQAAGAPKFMNKKQIAAAPDYVSQDLDRVYNSLSENYKPTSVSWDENRRAALEAGFSPSQIRDLKERDPGELSARLWRIQAAANMADAKVSEIEGRLGTAQQRGTDQADYLKALADFNYLSARVKGERGELARALQASKAAASFHNSTMEQVAEKLRAAGSGLAGLAEDPQKFMAFAQQIKALRAQGNVAAARLKMAGVNKPYWEQYLNSFHFNAMLSALSTHVKAPLDMMTGIGHNVIDHAIAMPVGKLYNLVEAMTGQKVKPGVSSAELAGRLWGPMRSVFSHEVYRNTLHAAATGEGSITLPNGQKISTTNTAYGAGNPRIGILSKPTDLISAQDTYFRSVAVAQNLYGLGNRMAEDALRKAGKPYTFDDVTTLGSSYAHNPTQSMLQEATDAAEKALLLNKNKVTGWIDAARAYRPGMTFPQRVGAFMAQNLAPFIRVASNSIITRQIERSPLPLLAPQTWKTLMAGGPEAHLAISRMVYGTIKLGLLWGAADQGKKLLTGEGPDDPNKKKELEAGGWRPNAVHENGQYNTGGQLAMSLNPFDVHNSTAHMVASAREAWDKGANQGQIGNAVKLALGSILHDMASESWVNDIAPAVDAATARGTTAGQKVAQFAGDEAKTWVPNALNQLNRTVTNPNQVDVRPDDPNNISGTMINSVASAIPGMSNGLPTKYSVYGDPMPTGASATGVHTVIPGLQGNSTPETHDPAEQELQRLGSLMAGDKALITPVQRTVKLEGVDQPRKLTTAEFEMYQHMVGREIVEHVRQEMQTPEWHNMSDEERAEEVKSIQTDMKKAVKEHLFNGQ